MLPGSKIALAMKKKTPPATPESSRKAQIDEVLLKLPGVVGKKMNALDAYFVYPEELRNSKRIQVFRDFLLRKVAESKMAP